MSTALAERPAVKKLIANARSAGARLKNHASGAKVSGVAAGVGFASDYAVEIAEEHFPQLQQYWYATPLVMLVGGHMLRKKSDAAGIALCAVAGARAAAGLKASQAAKPAAATTAAGLEAGRIAARRSFASPPPRRALEAGRATSMGGASSVASRVSRRAA